MYTKLGFKPINKLNLKHVFKQLHNDNGADVVWIIITNSKFLGILLVVFALPVEQKYPLGKVVDISFFSLTNHK